MTTNNTNKLFTASWCSPCKTTKLLLKDIPIEIEIVDVDDSPEEAEKHNVMGVPTMFYNNEVFVGTEVIKKLRSLL